MRAWWVLAVLLLPASGVTAQPAPRVQSGESRDGADFLRRARAFMTAMAKGNAVDARHIAAEYGDLARTSALRNRPALAAALADGRLRTLPDGASYGRVRPRLAGAHPIGEMDLPFQALYVAAHPAAIESLARIAASVSTGPIEVTSLVRHAEYQKRLRRINVNATSGASMHATGLAFDISVLNVPLSTAAAIGDVLLQMRAAGDVYFIAETRQLVFHVVPAAARLQAWTEIAHSTGTAGEPQRLATLPRLVNPAAPPSPWLLAPQQAAVPVALPGWTALAGALAVAAGAVGRAVRAFLRRRR